MNMQNIMDTITTALTALGLKILGAIAVWIIGRWLIGLTVRLVSAALTRQQVDPTLLRYIGNIVSVALNVVLVVAILGYFGLETTSFAALVAAMGIAIGAAWGGLLSNFAAGAFLITLRPFKVGDYIKAGGVEGTVMEIGTAQLAHGVNVHDAIKRLKESLVRIPNVITAPAPDVEVIDFNPLGPVLAVRPYTHTNHYWQVYFDTNKTITDTFGAAAYPVPEAHYHINRG